MSHNQQIGEKGELLAVQFLNKKGYTVKATNWRYKRAEVDIIAETDKHLVIVEVKTRKTEKFGLPEEAVGAKKQAQLIEAAEAYLEEHNNRKEVRFDVISIKLNTAPPDILHIEDAFYPYQE